MAEKERQKEVFPGRIREGGGHGETIGAWATMTRGIHHAPEANMEDKAEKTRAIFGSVSQVTPRGIREDRLVRYLLPRKTVRIN